VGGGEAVADDHVGGGEAAHITSALKGSGDDALRLRPRKQVVIIDTTTSGSDSSVKEDVLRQPSEGISSANISSAPGNNFL
jgi:hypothetical protein